MSSEQRSSLQLKDALTVHSPFGILFEDERGNTHTRSKGGCV